MNRKKFLKTAIAAPFALALPSVARTCGELTHKELDSIWERGKHVSEDIARLVIHNKENDQICNYYFGSKHLRYANLAEKTYDNPFFPYCALEKLASLPDSELKKYEIFLYTKKGRQECTWTLKTKTVFPDEERRLLVLKGETEERFPNDILFNFKNKNVI